MKDTSYITTLKEAAHLIFPLVWIVQLSFAFFHAKESMAMFLNVGESINLTIDNEFFDETIIYEGSAESSYLAKNIYLVKIQIYTETVYY